MKINIGVTRTILKPDGIMHAQMADDVLEDARSHQPGGYPMGSIYSGCR